MTHINVNIVEAKNRNFCWILLRVRFFSCFTFLLFGKKIKTCGNVIVSLKLGNYTFEDGWILIRISNCHMFICHNC